MLSFSFKLINSTDSKYPAEFMLRISTADGRMSAAVQMYAVHSHCTLSSTWTLTSRCQRLHQMCSTVASISSLTTSSCPPPGWCGFEDHSDQLFFSFFSFVWNWLITAQSTCSYNSCIPTCLPSTCCLSQLKIIKVPKQWQRALFIINPRRANRAMQLSSVWSLTNSSSSVQISSLKSPSLLTSGVMEVCAWGLPKAAIDIKQAEVYVSLSVCSHVHFWKFGDSEEFRYSLAKYVDLSQCHTWERVTGCLHERQVTRDMLFCRSIHPLCYCTVLQLFINHQCIYNVYVLWVTLRNMDHMWRGPWK